MTTEGDHRPVGSTDDALLPQSQFDDAGVESNARLTSTAGVVLLVLLAAEGVTVLRVGRLLSAHVFIGMLIVPPVLLKLVSTFYRFVRYYSGSPAYRRKGPPPAVLRMLGPFVVASTIAVLATGIALLFVGSGERGQMLMLHKVSFVLWFIAMALHVLGHLVDTARIAPRDWLHSTRRDVSGAGVRQWLVVTSVVLGIPLGMLFLGYLHAWTGTSAR